MSFHKPISAEITKKRDPCWLPKVSLRCLNVDVNNQGLDKLIYVHKICAPETRLLTYCCEPNTGIMIIIVLTFNKLRSPQTQASWKIQSDWRQPCSRWSEAPSALYAAPLCTCR